MRCCCFSPDVILCGWLASKHQLTNCYCFSPDVILCGWLASKHQLTNCYCFSSDVILCGWLASKHQLTNCYCFSPDVILCGWLASKHQLTNCYCFLLSLFFQQIYFHERIVFVRHRHVMFSFTLYCILISHIVNKFLFKPNDILVENRQVPSSFWPTQDEIFRLTWEITSAWGVRNKSASPGWGRASSAFFLAYWQVSWPVTLMTGLEAPTNLLTMTLNKHLSWTMNKNFASPPFV